MAAGKNGTVWPKKDEVYMQKLPHRITVGEDKVNVHPQYKKRWRYNGCYYPGIKSMEVQVVPHGGPRPTAAVRLTFWHEMTHAILFEMEHPLARNEPFVTRFAKLLSAAIDSAEFKDDCASQVQAVTGD